MDNFDDIFSNNNVTEEQVEVLEVEPPKEEKKKFSLDLKNDKILLIQIILISVWVILTTVIYFFGYPLFENFIDV